jgi:F-type H+-transporting ATPase subunit b
MNSYIIFGDIAGELAQSAREVATTFGLSWPNFIAQVISFTIVALALQRWAYKPILQVLEFRRQTISDGMANAEKIKAELARAEASTREILAQANNKANEMIVEARAAANRVNEVEIQKGVAAAEQIIAKAREASAAEHAKMLADLKREVGRLVVETTVRVSGKVLTMEDQQRLIRETNEQLAA